MTVFEFIGQFFVQIDVFKLQEVFSEHGIRVIIEKRTDLKLPVTSYFTDLRPSRCAKKISKTVLKTRLKT
jgi:hypothetical protein